MPIQQDYPPVQSQRLADGRQLAWYEFGDPNGIPCIYTTGTPASGLAGRGFHESAAAAGVRIISVDKPGYGHSDYLPNRQLTQYPEDIAALAQHLKLDRFAVIGESGGGPHVLALAWGIPERLTTVLSIAGMGPGHEDWVRQGMQPVNRRMFWLAQHAPWLVRLSVGYMARVLKGPKGREKFIAWNLAEDKKAERALMEREPLLVDMMLDAVRGAFRQGPRGATQEAQIFARPWGFELSEITLPVHIWHGTEDSNVPVAVARRVAEEMPNAMAHIIEGAGHLLVPDHGPAMMQQVVDAGS